MSVSHGAGNDEEQTGASPAQKLPKQWANTELSKQAGIYFA